VSSSLRTRGSLFLCLPHTRILSARHSMSSSRTIIASVASSLATVILTVSAHDRDRVRRVRKRFVVDSTVVTVASLAACSPSVVGCTSALVLVAGPR
jgi:hypothetical protein